MVLDGAGWCWMVLDGGGERCDNISASFILCGRFRTGPRAIQSHPITHREIIIDLVIPESYLVKQRPEVPSTLYITNL